MRSKGPRAHQPIKEGQENDGVIGTRKKTGEENGVKVLKVKDVIQGREVLSC